MSKVFITKYALTDGIKTVEAEIDGNVVMWKFVGGYLQFAHSEGKQWHRTEREAFERAELMRVAKIASLKKSIAKLERLKFM